METEAGVLWQKIVFLNELEFVCLKLTEQKHTWTLHKDIYSVNGVCVSFADVDLSSELSSVHPLTPWINTDTHLTHCVWPPFNPETGECLCVCARARVRVCWVGEEKWKSGGLMGRARGCCLSTTLLPHIHTHSHLTSIRCVRSWVWTARRIRCGIPSAQEEVWIRFYNWGQ